MRSISSRSYFEIRVNFGEVIGCEVRRYIAHIPSSYYTNTTILYGRILTKFYGEVVLDKIYQFQVVIRNLGTSW
jgi:hypothetical protein